LTDFSNGLDPVREATLTSPPEAYRYAENFMLAGYDANCGIGLWLHLGTCPDDFGLWEDQVFLTLPDDEGILWMTAYHRTPPEKRPAGGSLAFRCLRPFEQWQVVFDGMLTHSPTAEMLSGRVRDGRRERVIFDFDTRSVAPAWDNNLSAGKGEKTSRGSMAEQAWASEHYQQLFSLRGELTIGDRHFSIDTTGVRDHSRGQRGHDHSKWGGHNLWTAAFPSGRAFGMQRMWTPQQQISLNVGFVYLDGQFHHVDVIGEPCLLADHRVAGDELTLQLRSPLGEHHLTGTTVSTLFVNLESPYGLSVGYDPQAGFGTFAPGFSRWEWDGEEAYGLTERSGE
jgi:hypothetical protein